MNVFINDIDIACEVTEVQKEYFCPVSGFSTKKCPKYVFGEFRHDMKHKSKHRLVFTHSYSF